MRQDGKQRGVVAASSAENFIGTGQVKPFCEKRNRREGITRRGATVWRKEMGTMNFYGALRTPQSIGEVW